MPSHNVLRSVAHNMVHSFTSLMNYVGNDYAMGHLLLAARQTKKQKLLIDLLGKKATPEELLTPPVKSSVFRHIEWFPHLVVSSGSAIEYVHYAYIEIDFDISITRAYCGNSRYIESPYKATGKVIDDRGKTFETVLDGWWFPE